MSPPLEPASSTGAAEEILVIGSLSTAGDGLYQSVISGQQAQGRTVERQLVDRVLDNAVSLADERYSAVHIVLASNDYDELKLRIDDLLAAVSRALRPQGKLHIRGAPSASASLTAAGFSVVASTDSSEVVAEKRAESAQPSAKSVRLPRRNNDASAKKKQMLWALSEPAPGTPPVDADALLTDADRARPPPCEPFQANGAPRRKKACKGCTCGLAEIEAEEERVAVKVVLDATADALAATSLGKTAKVTSSCGSCYLGDAFRCASCPYLGLPAFEPGQKIELVGMDDDI